MIIRWGRKGLLAGALAVTFLTPAPTSNTINEVQAKQGHKLEFRHITPETVTGTGLNRVKIRPSFKLEFRHITPSGEVTQEVKSRPHTLMSDHDMILKEDQELLELITMLASIDGI